MQDSKHIINTLPSHAAYLPLADFWRVTSDETLNLGIYKRILRQPLQACVSSLIEEWKDRHFYPISTMVRPSNSRSGIKKQTAHLKSQFSADTDVTPLVFDILRLAKAFQTGSKTNESVNVFFTIQDYRSGSTHPHFDFEDVLVTSYQGNTTVWWPNSAVDRSVVTLERPDAAFITNPESVRSLEVGDVAFFTGEYTDGLAHNQPELRPTDPPRAVLQIRREPFM